jgi:Icc-related predicted phosphoesterase
MDGDSPTRLDGATASGDSATIRIAAAGDVHCRPTRRDEAKAAVAEIVEAADLFLLAGDLTTHGEPEQAEVLADACRGASIPIVAVLGNHDWHSGHHDEVVEILTDAGIRVLDPGHEILDLAGIEVGIAGAKGFVGGFPGCYLPDFGEPSLRRVYAEASAEIDAVDEGLRAIAHCELRVLLLHYAPVSETLRGEPPEIWAFLGTDRLAQPIVEHHPDLVLHGHAHIGTFEGVIEGVPVYNVSVPVMQRNYHVFELATDRTPTTPIH